MARTRLANAHIHTWEFPLRGIGANWVSKRDPTRAARPQPQKWAI